MEEDKVLSNDEEITKEDIMEIKSNLQEVDEDLIVKNDELTNEQANKLLTELRTGRRYFSAAGIGDLYIKTPTVRDQQEADWQYTKMLGKALKEGLPTNKEMEKILDERGLIKEIDEKVDKLTSQIVKLLVELDEIKNLEDKKSKKKSLELAKKIASLRDEATSLKMEKDSYFTNTAEGRANEARMGYLLYKCLYRVDTNERYWEDYEDYLNETNNNLLAQAMYQFITFSAGVSAEFIKEFPEIEVLSKLMAEEG